MLCRAADNELRDKANEMAAGLSKATIDNGDVNAAGLLLVLADSYLEEVPAQEKAFSLAERWASEPQAVELEVSPDLGTGRRARLALPDRTQPRRPSGGQGGCDDCPAAKPGSSCAEETVPDAEFEDILSEARTGCDAAHDD